MAAFRRFPQRPGQEIDFHEVGYLFLLDDPGTVTAFDHNVELQNQLGVPSRMMSVEAAGRLSPLVSPDGLLAAAFSPTDGHCTPESVVLGYAAGARMGMSDPEEVPGFSVDPSDAWLDRLTPAIARRAPRILDFGIRSGWAGLYEMTPDHNGLIGEYVPGGRFVYAAGFSGHGFLMAPAVGEVYETCI